MLLTVETDPMMVSDYANEPCSLHQLRIGSWSWSTGFIEVILNIDFLF